MTLHGTTIRKGKVLALIAAILLSALATLTYETEKAEAAGSYKIIGYYPAWGAYGRNYNVTDMDVTKVTHINYAFADICWNGIHGNSDPTSPNPATWSCQDEVGTINAPNGTIVLGDPWIDAQKSFPGDTWDKPIKGNIGQLIKQKQAHPNLKTIISIGGWSWSNRFSDVAASAATRETFANSAVDFLRKYQFDGVDLDWEYPVSGGLAGNSVRAADKQNYTLLLQKVREKLNTAGAADGKTYTLTIASGAGPNFVQNTELSQIAAIVDWINIMTYDFNGGWQTISAHNSPLYYDPAAAAAGVPDAATFNAAAGVQGHLNAGVPASKLVLGMPFYARGWSGCAATGNGQYASCTGPSPGTWEPGVLDFSNLEAQYINKNGYTRYWNNVAKVPYLYNPSNGVFISYDDTESFGHKTSYIKSTGLGGAMFWEFSGDRNKTLLTKLANDLAGTSTGDTTPPSVPANVHMTSKTSSSVSLAWNASTDNVGVTGYTVTYGTTSINVPGTSATVSGLSANTAYTFTVKAFDAAGNVSNASAPVQVTTDTGSSCTVAAWNAGQAYTQGQRASYNGITYEAKWWTQGDQPDLSGEWGVWKVIGPCGGGTDTTAPSIPANLQSTGKTSTTVSLSWSASTDNVGVTGYIVLYGTTSVNVTGTSAVLTGLSPNTTYDFTVKARDAAGNLSGASAALQVKTDAASGGTSWAPNVSYQVNDTVTYGGVSYTCLQAHTSLTGWEPPNVPALWKTP
jgi:chitinase